MAAKKKTSAKKPAAKPAKKPAATKPGPSTRGRAPPDLRALGDGFDELAEFERLAVTKPYDATVARRAFVAGAHNPAKAAALIERIGFDFGDVPSSVDTSAAKTTAERTALERAHTVLVAARLQRQESLAALYAIAARDVALQTKMFAKVDTLPGDDRFRGMVLHALMTSAPLAAPLLEAAKQWLKGEQSMRRSTAIIALFKHGDDVAYATIGTLLAKLDRDDEDAVLRAKDIVEAGTAIGWWSTAREEWRALLASFAALAEGKFDFSKGDLGRALWQLGTKAKDALKNAPAHPQEKARVLAPPIAMLSMNKPRLDAKKLRTDAGREALLDELATWIVEELVGANDDDARATIRGAISAFYDVREAAEQPRGEFAGSFFQVDAVGLGASTRPVPWVALRARVGDARTKQLDAFFDEVESTVE